MTQKRDSRRNAAGGQGRRSRACLWSIHAGIALCLMAGSAIYGQGVTGRIEGTVQDPSRAGVPGATVAVANQDTGYHADATTGQGGDYVVPNMPPGKYTVTVTAA